MPMPQCTTLRVDLDQIEHGLARRVAATDRRVAIGEEFCNRYAERGRKVQVRELKTGNQSRTNPAAESGALALAS